jgi:isopenicillin N synthase-like dioxygenase
MSSIWLCWNVTAPSVARSLSDSQHLAHEDAFVANAGDMLHRMFNVRRLSTPHRVINRSGRERFSCPFIFDPHVHIVIQPLPGTGKPKFSPIQFGAFLQAELEAGYDTHRVARDASDDD